MATRYGGVNSKRVSLNDIQDTTLTNMTLISQGNDDKGGYFISAYVNVGAGGCGAGPNPSMLITIKNDVLPRWSKITFRTYGTFTASCWYLNESDVINNFYSWNVAAGDNFITKVCVNCFELPQFTQQTQVCDNNSTNAFHSAYKVGTYRVWYQTRRRNSLTAVAGPGIRLSCNTTGNTSIITFSDMFVFL